jgi:arginine decarboxylase
MKKLAFNTSLFAKRQKPVNTRKGVLIGNRIPKDYFVTQGFGESDITIHAGSYHLALKNAGIEMSNLMSYSSILPGIANEISRPKHLEHGAVMETIMAVSNGKKGEELSAGIIYGWLTERATGKRYGGLVCEHNGNFYESELKHNLQASLHELYYNGFEENFHLGETRIITRRASEARSLSRSCFSL